jgi:D-arabinose 1-dehydrogenase-like Zn-dependent alcohol dehydrogenase
MKAIRFDEFGGPIVLAEVAEPECPADGVVIEVRACGVCRSDWHGWKGSVSRITPPHVPGHEFAGVIVETGRDCRRFGKGMRVTAPFILACGQTATFENSLRGLAPLGRHVQIGMPSGIHATPALPLYELIYARQLQILGTRGLAASRFPALFAAIQAGRMDPSRLVTRRITLEEAPAAIAEMDGYTRVGVTVIDRF